MLLMLLATVAEPALPPRSGLPFSARVLLPTFFAHRNHLQGDVLERTRVRDAL
jgi:hypothetical protein